MLALFNLTAIELLQTETETISAVFFRKHKIHVKSIRNLEDLDLMKVELVSCKGMNQVFCVNVTGQHANDLRNKEKKAIHFVIFHSCNISFVNHWVLYYVPTLIFYIHSSAIQFILVS